MVQSLRKPKITKKTGLTMIFWGEILLLCFVMFMIGYMVGEYL